MRKSLRRKIAIALLCSVFLVVFAKFEYSKSRANVVRVLVSTPQLQSVDIGFYENEKDAADAAEAELQRQIASHPKLNNFQVIWREPEKNSRTGITYWQCGLSYYKAYKGYKSYDNRRPYVVVPGGIQKRFSFFHFGYDMDVGSRALVTS